MPKVRYDGKDHDSITSYIASSSDEEWRRLERKAHGYYGVRTPSGARMYAHTRNIEVDYIDVSSAEPEGVVLDAVRDLVVMGAYRISPRTRKMRWIWGLGPTMCTVPLKGRLDPDRVAVMHALWDLDQGETSCALALVQKWSDEFPRDSAWAFDLTFEIGRFISEHPGVTRREVWEGLPPLGQPTLLRIRVYEALRDMAHDDRLRTDPKTYYSYSAKYANVTRFYVTATTPDRPNPFLLASAGLIFKAGEQS